MSWNADLNPGRLHNQSAGWYTGLPRSGRLSIARPQPRARRYATCLNTFEQAASWSFTSCFASGPDGPLPIEYERHEPEKTLLHEVVREQLEPFLARARRDGAPVARFVERELRAYLDCGILAHGFLRLHCDTCGRDRLLAFSCKGRGLCPSCGGRRMADTAAHLVDCVLPEVPVRQWVLTLPYPLRYRCAWDARLTSEVLRAFLRSLFADQRRRARIHHAVKAGLCGAVTAIQRFGSALNTNPPHAPGPFLPLPPPGLDDIVRVMAGTARRVIRLLEKRGLENEDDPLATDDPLLATLIAASVRSRIATGPEATRKLRLLPLATPRRSRRSGRARRGWSRRKRRSPRTLCSDRGYESPCRRVASRSG
ncbi:MAG: transposase zinc-binding domain-containing protein [Deltaproteobacteria bacterium]|nr:transposase zinc-binding domain-containing protein [Deltaproteobacteria bacterium]